MSDPTRYYRYSGAIPLGGAALAASVTMLAAFLLAWVYGYIVAYIPLIYFNMIVCGFFGVLIGLVATKGVQWGKIRNASAAGVLGLLGGVLGLHVSWTAWMCAHSSGEVIPWTTGEVLKVLSYLSEKGAWSIFGWTPTAIPLQLVWVVEALIIVGAAVIVAWTCWNEHAFCEKCNCWCAPAENFGPYQMITDWPAFTARLEAKDVGALQELVPVVNTENCALFSLHHCPRCQGVTTYKAEEKTVVIGDKGERNVETRAKFDLLLGPREWRELFPRGEAG